MLNIEQVVQVLNKYYPGTDWRCASPITTNPPLIDELGNILEGLDWKQSNTTPKPSVADLEAKWDLIKATGEYRKQFPAIPGKERVGPFNGKTSEYAQELLKESDWAALPDVGLANQADWGAYRNQLRTIRSTPSDTASWPTRPPVTYS